MKTKEQIEQWARDQGWVVANGLNTPLSQSWLYNHFIDSLRYGLHSQYFKQTVMNNKVETTKEKVLEAAKQSSIARKLMMELYPEVFENNTKLCDIGCIFFRKSYPTNIYAVMKQNSEVVIVNITYSSKWDQKKVIKMHELKDPMQKSITVSEFSKLTGYINMSEFTIVDKNCNKNLFEIVTRYGVQTPLI